MGFFRQPKLPKTANLSNLKYLNKGTLSEAFISYILDQPDKVNTVYKDEDEEYTKELKNIEILSHALEIYKLLKEKNVCLILADNSPFLSALELAVWLRGGASCAIYTSDSNLVLKEKMARIKPDQVFISEGWKGAKPEENIRVPVINLEESWKKAQKKIKLSLGYVLRALKEIGARPTDEKKVAKFYFSSGTSGKPKLIPLTHENLMNSLRGWVKGLNLTPDIRAVYYLPHAHVFQGTVSLLGMIGYFEAYISSPESLKEDLPNIRPNIMVAVPRVLEKMKAGIIKRLSSTRIFSMHNFKDLNDNRLTKKLLLRYGFGRLTTKVAGLSECLWLISGGAALPLEVEDFFKDALGIRIKQGYGMTETSAGITISGIKTKKGSSGKLIDGTKAKIKEDGVLWVKSNSVMAYGYDFNGRHLDSEGFFCTGDLARIDDEGFIFVKGRSDNRVKMLNGRYYNLEEVSDKIKGKFPEIECCTPVIENKSAGEIVIKLKEEMEDPGDNMMERWISWINKETGLPRIEKIVVLKDVTSENNLLTPTQKVRHKKIIELWKKVESTKANQKIVRL